jgi:hypothetical protein
MPLDPSQVQWDSVDPAKVQWDAPPLSAAKDTPAISAGRDNAVMIGAGRMSDRLLEGFKQSGLGIGAILSELLPERLKNAAQDAISKKLIAQDTEQADRTARYKPLAEEHPIATGVGEALPLVAAPQLRVMEGAGALPAIVNSAVSSALPAMAEYGTAGERGERGGLAAAGGAAGTTLLQAGAKVLKPVASSLTPETQRLAGVAESMGIPLTAGDKTGNKFVKTVEAVMQEMPSTAGAQNAIQQTKREAFTRAVMQRLGEDTGEATGETVGRARARIGGDFDRIFSKMEVPIDNPKTQQALGAIIQDANATLPADTAKIVANRVSQLIDKVDANGNVPGTAYQAWRTEVQNQAKGSGNGWLTTKLRDVYRAVDQVAYDAANQAGEAANLGKARAQYRDLLAIEPLVDKSVDGRLSPGLVLGAANQRGTDALKEAGRVGKAFVMDQVANSGSAQRAAAQAMLSGGLGLGMGGVTYGITQDPVQAMKMGSMAAIGQVALPKAAQLAINSAAGQRYLTSGIGRELTPIERALIDRAIRTGAISGARGLVPQ